MPDSSSFPHPDLFSPVAQAPEGPLKPGPLLSPTPATFQGLEPTLKRMQRRVTISLISQELEAPCHFWVGLAKSGPLAAKALLDCQSIAEIYSKAAEEGIQEAGPVMLSDASAEVARFFYILPPPAADKAKGRQEWVSALVSVIQAWAPLQIGFCLAPKLLAGNAAQSLLQEVLQKVIVTSVCQDYYLLLGSLGLNPSLNTVLSLRRELFAHEIDLLVFH